VKLYGETSARKPYALSKRRGPGSGRRLLETTSSKEADNTQEKPSKHSLYFCLGERGGRESKERSSTSLSTDEDHEVGPMPPRTGLSIREDLEAKVQNTRRKGALPFCEEVKMKEKKQRRRIDTSRRLRGHSQDGCALLGGVVASEGEHMSSKKKKHQKSKERLPAARGTA